MFTKIAVIVFLSFLKYCCVFVKINVESCCSQNKRNIEFVRKKKESVKERYRIGGKRNSNWRRTVIDDGNSRIGE
jgi:hypothetical protein